VAILTTYAVIVLSSLLRTPSPPVLRIQFLPDPQVARNPLRNYPITSTDALYMPALIRMENVFNSFVFHVIITVVDILKPHVKG